MRERERKGPQHRDRKREGDISNDMFAACPASLYSWFAWLAMLRQTVGATLANFRRFVGDIHGARIGDVISDGRYWRRLWPRYLHYRLHLIASSHTNHGRFFDVRSFEDIRRPASGVTLFWMCHTCTNVMNIVCWSRCCCCRTVCGHGPFSRPDFYCNRTTS